MPYLKSVREVTRRFFHLHASSNVSVIKWGKHSRLADSSVPHGHSGTHILTNKLFAILPGLGIICITSTESLGPHPSKRVKRMWKKHPVLRYQQTRGIHHITSFHILLVRTGLWPYLTARRSKNYSIGGQPGHQQQPFYYGTRQECILEAVLATGSMQPSNRSNI